MTSQNDNSPGEATDPGTIHAGGGHFLSRLSLPRPRHLVIILMGVTFNLMTVTLGLDGAFGLSLPLALVGAVMLSLVQTVIFEEVFRNGLWLGLGGAVFYGFIVSLNVLLAAGGITAGLGADILGQSTFRASVTEQVRAIHAVADSTGNFADAMDRIASHSEQQHAIEIARGGTCTDSGRGDGPISRLRQDDAAAFSHDRDAMQQIAANARQASLAIDTAITNYTVSRHDEIVRTIAATLAAAQRVARAQGIQDVRAELQARAGQIATGRPDRLDPSARIVCPRDAMLRTVIDEALAYPAPTIPADFVPPPVPSESSSVWGLITALGSTLFGSGGDLGPWRLSILLAPAPDSFFIYGLLLHRRTRRARLSHRDRLAEHFGFAPGTDAEAALERALASTRVQALYSSHVRHRRLLFQTDYLVVPYEATARRRALLAMDGSELFDCGIWSGATLPIPTADLDPCARFQLFALAKGVWARMEAEEIRAALADFDAGGPSDPWPETAAESREEQAA